MQFTAKQVADILEGVVEGTPDEQIAALSKIEEGTAGSLSFLSNLKYAPYLYTTKASVVILDESYVLEKPVKTTLIRVKDSRRCFAKLIAMYDEFTNNKQGIEQPCFISKTAQLSDAVYVGAFAYIGENVKIGKGVQIYPHTYVGDNTTIGQGTVLYSGVKVYHQTEIGKNCTIHSGAVIGSDGFGFTPDEKGIFQKVPHIGNVVIQDDVEIGANTAIDRATLGTTIIEKGVKLDNLVQIAHNVAVGKHTVIAGQTGVAGSTKIGAHAMVGGQVGIVGHLTLGDYVKVQAQSGITKNIPSKTTVRGTPAMNYRKYNSLYILFKKLPEMLQRIETLEKTNTI